MAGQWEDIEKILIENISLDEQFDEVKAQLSKVDIYWTYMLRCDSIS